MNPRSLPLAVLFALLALPLGAAACAPIVQLVILYSGLTLGTANLTPDGAGAIALVVAVAAKMLAFAWFERRIAQGKAAGAMFVA